MNKLIKILLSTKRHREFMVLGTKDFPVNPNDSLPWTEKDNPYIFNSLENAENFVKHTEEQNIINDEDILCYLRIVELL